MTEQIETTNETIENGLFTENGAHVTSNPPAGPGRLITPQAGCGTCGSSEASADLDSNSALTTSHIYAIGRVEARFPNLSAEKEFAQVMGRMDTKGQTDQNAFQSVLSQRENRYLVRQMCWIMSIQGLDTYILMPR